MLNQNRTRFLAQESPDGEKWLESEAAKKRKISGRDGGTMFDTGAMFHSIHIEEIGSTGSQSSLAQQSINIPDDAIPYAKYHHLGQGQVQRVLLGASNSDVDKAEEIAKGFYLRYLGF
jgi:hypothetical protein